MPELYLLPLGTKDSDRGDLAGAIVILDFLRGRAVPHL
jgi:hypothetical protein